MDSANGCKRKHILLACIYHILITLTGKLRSLKIFNMNNSRYHKNLRNQKVENFHDMKLYLKYF